MDLSSVAERDVRVAAMPPRNFVERMTKLGTMANITLDPLALDLGGGGNVKSSRSDGSDTNRSDGSSESGTARYTTPRHTSRHTARRDSFPFARSVSFARRVQFSARSDGPESGRLTDRMTSSRMEGSPAPFNGSVMEMPQGMPALLLGQPGQEGPGGQGVLAAAGAAGLQGPGGGRGSAPGSAPSSRLNTSRDRPGYSPKVAQVAPEPLTSLDNRPRTPSRGDSKG